MSDFLHMGGYAFFVWASYLLALVILVVNYVVPIQREKGLLRRIARLARRREQ